jgi:hypothetical protein
MYGIEMWGLEGGWKEKDKIQFIFCKKILQVPRSAANVVAELDMGRDSRKSKVAMKCWLRVYQIVKQDLVRECCECQIHD